MDVPNLIDYGFIAAADNGESLFFHITELDHSLEMNEQLLERRVEFEIVTKDGRFRAVDVRAAD